MPHIVTQHCCSDAACVPACPVNCIHPAPGEPDFDSAEMLYIDPEVCIDCGACADVCPVRAIAPDYDLAPESAPYVALNASWYDAPGRRDYRPERVAHESGFQVSPTRSGLTVAVVGSGPSACYAAELLLDAGAAVTMFERLPTPWGLARAGVAPDHQETKQVVDGFERTVRRAGLTLHLNVEVGHDVTRDQLLETHHAVVYATGMSRGRRIGIPGEDLPGSHSAADFVAWYNGHPDHASARFPLDGTRAVVIGNGNVALDAARMLLTPARALAQTDIAPHALEELSTSKVREVVLVGRRGAADAAFTLPELLGACAHPGFVTEVHPHGVTDQIADPAVVPDDPMARAKAALLATLVTTGAPWDRRLLLRFMTAPRRILGTEKVEGVEVAPTHWVSHRDTGRGHRTLEIGDATETVDCSMVLGAIGFRGTPLEGVAFDDVHGTVPHQSGRVLNPTGAWFEPGVYATGWIKRGPTGGLGLNRRCASETVTALLDDYDNGRLPRPRDLPGSLLPLLLRRTDLTGWERIDRHETRTGRAQGRPRTKVVSLNELTAIATDEE